MTMSMKQIHTKVSKHLLKQGKRSERFEGADNTCLYRSDDGLMCAVGCLIPDDHYHCGLEDHDVDHPIVKSVLVDVLGANLDRKLDLLSRLQYIHDQVPVEDWSDTLEGLKKDYKGNFQILGEGL